MKKIILALILAATFSLLHAQTRFVGYLYTYQRATKERFEYSVSTLFSEGVYKTVYKVFRPGSNKNRYTITASHFKDLKKVVVEVNDEQYILTVMTGREETIYDEPTLALFGFRGTLGILDKAAPSQLAVQFLSGRYDYVKVLRFLGSSVDGIFQFFIFSESDKIPVPRSGQPTADNKPRPKAVFHGISGTNSNLSNYLPAPSAVLGYTYQKLIDSLNRNNVHYKKDSSFDEGEFDGYQVATPNGTYFVNNAYLLGSYQFRVPAGKQDVVSYYIAKGAILKRCEGFNCAFEYGDWFVDVGDLDNTHSLISYSSRRH